jgi:hypothetical protein
MQTAKRLLADLLAIILVSFLLLGGALVIAAGLVWASETHPMLGVLYMVLVTALVLVLRDWFGSDA